VQQSYVNKKTTFDVKLQKNSIKYRVMSKQVYLSPARFNSLIQGSLTKGSRRSTVDLLVLTSLDQLLFVYKILFTFFTKQATLIRMSTVLSLTP
jgi:hypothetical protein